MFKVHISNDSTRVGLKQSDTFSYYNAGEVFEPEHCDENVLYTAIKTNSIPTLIGEFAYLFEDDDFIYAINDELGTILWYYHLDEQSFTISNNYWDIVTQIEPTVDDLDKQAIYEKLMLIKPFDQKTFIKGIYSVPPGGLLKYDKKAHSLSVDIYSDINYVEDKSISKEKMFDEIDALFDKMMKKVRQVNNNPRIGITISGGLDSRFPLPFLKKEEVTAAYLIGQCNNFMKPYDYDSAKTMADMYGLSLTMIDPFKTPIKEKILIDLLRHPTVSSNIMKAIDYKQCFKGNEFDVLITGAYGGCIGGKVLSTDLLTETDNSAFAYKLFYGFSLFTCDISQYGKDRGIVAKIRRKCRTLTNILFRTNLKRHNVSKIDQIKEFVSGDFLFPSSYKKAALDRFHTYVEEERALNKDNLSVIMKFHMSRHFITGSFESLNMQVKAYSIYHPYIYHYSKTWPQDYLKDRFIMEEYLFHKHRKLADVPGQTFDNTISFKFQPISAFKSFVERVLVFVRLFFKGLAISYNKWFFRPDFQQEIRDCFKDDDSYFYQLISKKDMALVLNHGSYLHFTEDLFKLKLFVDLIESGEYKQLLSKDVFQETSKH